MLLTIADVLNSDELTRIVKQLQQARFVDGRLSAGRDAKRSKNNQELSISDPLTQTLNQQTLAKLHQHPSFQAAAMPLRLSAAFFTRYRAGMSYGRHVDDAIMGQGAAVYRSDISITLFLSNPSDYEGGELCIETELGEQFIKLPAGHAVIYPSGHLHRVATVTSGERLAAVAWAQSLVKDSDCRALLYDLYVVKEALLSATPNAKAAARANRAYINLYRKWANL